MVKVFAHVAVVFIAVVVIAGVGSGEEASKSQRGSEMRHSGWRPNAVLRELPQRAIANHGSVRRSKTQGGELPAGQQDTDVSDPAAASEPPPHSNATMTTTAPRPGRPEQAAAITDRGVSTATPSTPADDETTSTTFVRETGRPGEYVTGDERAEVLGPALNIEREEPPQVSDDHGARLMAPQSELNGRFAITGATLLVLAVAVTLGAVALQRRRLRHAFDATTAAPRTLHLRWVDVRPPPRSRKLTIRFIPVLESAV